MDTSGFYKKISDNEWWYATNFVYHKDYTLARTSNRTSIDGWDWHEIEPTEYTIWKSMNIINNDNYINYDIYNKDN